MATEINDRTKVSMGILLAMVGAFGMGVVSLIRSSEALGYARRDLDKSLTTLDKHEERLDALERFRERWEEWTKRIEPRIDEIHRVVVEGKDAVHFPLNGGK